MVSVVEGPEESVHVEGVDVGTRESSLVEGSESIASTTTKIKRQRRMPTTYGNDDKDASTTSHVQRPWSNLEAPVQGLISTDVWGKPPRTIPHEVTDPKTTLVEHFPSRHTLVREVRNHHF